MLSKEVVELSKQHSIIRDIFEYGMKRAKEVGAENVFDSVSGIQVFQHQKKLMRQHFAC